MILCFFKKVKQKRALVPVRVIVGFSHPSIRSNNALNVTALHPAILLPAVLICGIRRSLSSCAPSTTLDGNDTCTTRGSFRFLLFALLDGLVFAMMGSVKAIGGAGSSGAGGMGVGSTHSSSSRSVEADEIVRNEKSTAVGLLLCVMATVGPAAALGVMDRRGRLRCRHRRRHFSRSPGRRVMRSGQGVVRANYGPSPSSKII